MSWSNAITQLIESGNPIPRTCTLFCRNGYQKTRGEGWHEIDIAADGWEISIEDSNPVVSNARFTIPYEKKYLTQNDPDNPLGLFAEGMFRLTVDTPLGQESNYIFRGTLRTRQQGNWALMIEGADPLSRMDVKSGGLSMIAEIIGPLTDVLLTHDASGIWDVLGTEYTFEISPILYSWAYDPLTGGNRSFVPGVFEIEQDMGGGTWSPVPASEYTIDTVLGLVRFGNDEIGNSFRIKSVSVYVEGTLEFADVMETLLKLSGACGTLGCGFTDAMLRIPCTGTLTFVNDPLPPPYTVTGVGTDFQGELKVGDRIALDSDPTNYGVITYIHPVNQYMELRYIYPGVLGASGTYFKSSLSGSGISLTNISWNECDGTAADLYRQLQENYADSKGYKLWYNPMDDRIYGERVRIMDVTVPSEAAKIIDVPPLIEPPLIQELTEDFASAIRVSGEIGRAHNLCSMPGVTISDLLIGTATPPPGGYVWKMGPTNDTWPNWAWGLHFSNNVNALIDGNVNEAYGIHAGEDFMDAFKNMTLIAQWIISGNYPEFCKIDLQAIYQIDQIDILRMNSAENRTTNRMALNIYISSDDITYILYSPEAYKYPIGYNETASFKADGMSGRYIKVCVLPTFITFNNPEMTIGLREIVVYGSMKICEEVCIQGDIAHGARQNGSGAVTLTAGSYFGTGAATNFGGVGEPQVGDYVAASTDLLNWVVIESILAPTGANCLKFKYAYGGAGAVGNVIFSDGNGPYVEGEGGHFVGGVANDDNFIRDYYPDLIAKISPFGHSLKIDDAGLILTQMQAIDRAYLILNDLVRIYRAVSTSHAFDCRPKLFDTLRITDDYRIGAPEEILILVQKITLNDRIASYAGTDYSTGVLS